MAIRTTVEIIEDLRARLLLAVPDADLSPQGPFGQVINFMLDLELHLQDKEQSIRNDLDWTKAVGDRLDYLAYQYKVYRLQPTYSTIQRQQFIGEVGTTLIPFVDNQGLQFQDNLNNFWTIATQESIVADSLNVIEIKTIEDTITPGVSFGFRFRSQTKGVDGNYEDFSITVNVTSQAGDTIQGLLNRAKNDFDSKIPDNPIQPSDPPPDPAKKIPITTEVKQKKDIWGLWITYVENRFQVVNYNGLEVEKLGIIAEARSTEYLSILLAENSFVYEDGSFPGLISTTNLTDSIPGKVLELDTSLRTRIAHSEGIMSNSLEGMKRYILNKIGLNVTKIDIGTNYTDTDKPTGIPSWHIELVIEGGIKQDVINAIGECLPAGILTTGNTKGFYTDDYGQQYPILFSRPDIAYIWFKVTVSKDVEVPFVQNWEETIKENIVNFGKENFQIGRDIYTSHFVSSVVSVAGIGTVTIEVARTSSPTSPPPEGHESVHLVLRYREKAEFDKSRIFIIVDDN